VLLSLGCRKERWGKKMKEQKIEKERRKCGLEEKK
jgi:hypothetical protein